MAHGKKQKFNQIIQMVQLYSRAFRPSKIVVIVISCRKSGSFYTIETCISIINTDMEERGTVLQARFKADIYIQIFRNCQECIYIQLLDSSSNLVL